MARGKYANRAEAAKAREMAQEEATRLRRDVERLTKENEALQGALNDTLGAMHAETARLRTLVVEGTSEALDEARAALAQARKDILVREEGHRVISEALERTASALQFAYEDLAFLAPADAYEQQMRVTKFAPAPFSEQVPGYVRCDDIPAAMGSEFAVNVSNKVKDQKRRPLDWMTPEQLERMHRIQQAKGLRAARKTNA